MYQLSKTTGHWCPQISVLSSKEKITFSSGHYHSDKYWKEISRSFKRHVFPRFRFLTIP
jgi:hypothetical protein